jgi:hypothetical protein
MTITGWPSQASSLVLIDKLCGLCELLLNEQKIAKAAKERHADVM